MKRAFKNKISGTKKLVRRIVSKSSNASHESVLRNQESAMIEEALTNEITALRDQISNLKAAISTLSGETERKEVAIAKLAREKEQLHLELLKQKRANNTLAQQLEDERNFYFKEKEIYCQEMNECKKLKRLASSSSALTGEEKTLSDYKMEIMKLKQTLNQTLEANYNLSIKFLRMKNTKTCLKTQLKTMKLEHEKLENDYKTKIENLSAELNDLVNEKLQLPMSPSSKKYLQLVKQNSCVVYENLCLQLEVDNLHSKFEKLTLDRTRSETNSRLRYITHSTELQHPQLEKSSKSHHRIQKDPKRVRIQVEAPEKLEKDPKPSCSKSKSSKDERVLKIYERKQLPGVPEIKIINEKETKLKERKKKTTETRNQKQNNTELRIRKGDTDISNYQLKSDYLCTTRFENKSNSKLALFQVSGMQSVTSGDCVSMTSSGNCGISRSHSSPDLVIHSILRKASNEKT